MFMHPTSITALISPDFSCAQRARSRGVSASVVRWVTSLASGTAPLRIEAATWSKSALQRVAAADQRHLALVEFRVGKDDVVLDDADQHQRAAMRDMGEGRLHRGGVAGGVENHVEPFAAGRFAHQFGDRCLGAVERRRSRVRFRRNPAARVLMSSSAHVEPGDAGEQRRAEADRAGADDQRAGAGFGAGAPHGMRADGEEFDRRGIGQRQAVCRIKILRRHQDLFGTWRRRDGRRAPRS